jgi:hypothetical protein
VTVDYDAVQDEVHRRYPFFQSDLVEQKKLFERGRSDGLAISEK